MKSKASIKGHPLHPILVSFPIAFFIGTLCFDVLGLVFTSQAFPVTALYLNISGIAFALLAAVPGIMDYFLVIPPNSSAKKRGAKHGLLNTAVIIIFIVVLVIRQRTDTANTLVVGLEILGVILLSIAGWLGGTLVYRNQIGVDIRYAHAGKWKEEYIKDAGREIAVATIDELKPNQMKLVHVKDKRIVVCRTEKGYAAFDDRCTHRGGSLAGGTLICGTVQCPWHGSQFDVNTGTILAGPAKEKIITYLVKEVGQNVTLILQEAERKGHKKK